jgi:hypothetical protein
VFHGGASPEMASAAEHPPESVPPQMPLAELASGAEIAPLVNVRAAQEAAQAAALLAEAKSAREASEKKEACRERKVRVVRLLCASGATTTLLVLLVLLVSYFSSGCGACENDAACLARDPETNNLRHANIADGLVGECVCTGNHAGEYCEHSCGEFGRVNGSACELDGKVGNMIMRSSHNDATVQAVTYTGRNAALSWQLQHELCNAAGRATPGSNSFQGRAGGRKVCSYSPSDNYVVTDSCSGRGWAGEFFTYVSGSLSGGVGYMCANTDCNPRVRVEGNKTSAESSYEPTTLRDGDAVFCSSCLLDDESCARAKTDTDEFLGIESEFSIRRFLIALCVCPVGVVLFGCFAIECFAIPFSSFVRKAAPWFLLVWVVLSIGFAVYMGLPKQPDGDERLASVLTNI